MKKIKIIHFVTGGFSGATKVAVDLIQAHQQKQDIESSLILRKKKTTTPQKLAELTDKNINYRLITGKAHLLSILALKKLCEAEQADILVCHGFPEHIIGRWAGLLAKVPVLIQVEHNSKERYTPWRMWQSRRLSRHTHCAVGVSEGVQQVLQAQRLSCTTVAIANGIDTLTFGSSDMPPLQDRPKDIIMVARFAKSKDHISLIKALNLLKNEDITPKLFLVGGGKHSRKHTVQSLITKYGLDSQVEFIEYTNQVHQLLSEHKIFVMSSNFEGMNLAVLEAMASGCLVIGSRALGVQELIEHQQDGLLFDIGDANQLATHIKAVLLNPEKYQLFAQRAIKKVQSNYSKKMVSENYYQLFKTAINQQK